MFTPYLWQHLAERASHLKSGDERDYGVVQYYLSLISFQGSGHGGSVKETLVFFKYDAEVPRRCPLVLGLGVAC
jgi:hypothetical protein